jgi:heme oxygenase
MSTTVLERLRGATRELHETLEARLDILTQMESLAGRRALAERFHALHAGVEAAVAPKLERLPGLDFDQRLRTKVLAIDLEALGAKPSPPAPVAPAGTTSEALGFLYVLEGSSLGGHVIRKQALAKGLDLRGMSFLNPYGEQTGAYWKGFLAVLERECPAHDTRRGEAAAQAAVAGFTHAQAVLCEDARP